MYFNGFQEVPHSQQLTENASNKVPDTGGDILPFNHLDGRRFEILVYTLKRLEIPDTAGRVRLMQGVGERGRDVVVYSLEGKVTQIIQCKRYDERFDEPALRREILKLALHNYLDASILDDASVIYEFWCPGGLTEPAAKFLDTWPTGWTADMLAKDANAVIAKYEGFKQLDWNQIGEAVVSRFNNKVRPTQVEGIDISARVRKSIPIYETFFQGKVVMDREDTLDILQSVVDGAVEKSLQHRLDLIIQAKLDPGFMSLAELVKRSEELHPSLTFEVIITADKTETVIRARSGSSEVTVGTLGFPDTEAGRRGIEKLRRAQDEGRDAEFEGDECEWTPMIRSPADHLSTNTRVLSRLSMRPQVPDLELPIRLEVVGEIQSPNLISNMKLVRMGLKETELQLAGGQFAGRLSVVIPAEAQTARGNWLIDFSCAQAACARRTAEFFLALARQDKMRIVSLQLEKPLFEMPADGIKIPISELEAIISLLLKLEYLNETLSTDLRFCGEATWMDLHRVDLLCEGLKTGEVEDDTVAFPIKASVYCTFMQQFVQAWRDGVDVSVDLRNSYSWSYCGTKLSVGDTITTFHRVVPVRTPDELEAQLSEAGGAETVDIELTCIRMTHKFSRLPSTT